MAHLKVCFAEGAFRNCSQCVKCHRKLLVFDALGVLDKATSFDIETYRRNQAREFFVSSANDEVRAPEVRELALRNGRPDIARIVEESRRRSRRARAIALPLRRASWRVGQSVYRSLTADMIGA